MDQYEPIPLFNPNARHTTDSFILDQLIFVGSFSIQSKKRDDLPGYERIIGNEKADELAKKEGNGIIGR